MRAKLSSMLTLLLLLFGITHAGTYSGGSGTSGDPWQIANLDDLSELCQTSGDWGAYFIQTVDIDATTTSGWDGGSGWSPIGNETTAFTGSYNGQGYTISGLTIDRSETNYIGLFGFTNGATIRNMGMVGGSATGSNYVGALAGDTDNRATVENCYSTVSVSGTDYVGGLVGKNSISSTVQKSYSTGSVSGNNYVGGLVGSNDDSSEVINSYATGSISGASYVGGLVGRNSDNVTNVLNSYSTGSVSGTGSDIGGLVGINSASATVSTSFWDTETSGQASSAGGTGKTTTEMKTLSTFTDAGWDFEIETTNGTNDYWDMDQSGSTNSGYPFLSWQNGTDTSLPVSLSTFSAKAMNGYVQLIWATDSEIENLGFNIYRANGEEAFQLLASFTHHKALEGHGSTNEYTEYAFQDARVTTGSAYRYLLADVDYNGVEKRHEERIITLTYTPDAGMKAPEIFSLKRAYPNPFNPGTVIQFSLTASEQVNLSIYDVRGRVVRTLVNGAYSAGEHAVAWDARDEMGRELGAGLYFCRMNVQGRSQLEKLVLIR